MHIFSDPSVENQGGRRVIGARYMEARKNVTDTIKKTPSLGRGSQSIFKDFYFLDAKLLFDCCFGFV